ncbi:MAG TPA: nucleotidyltransferase family protein, partial [Thermomicrobiales bacterium]|nr:nucleotidyltransferase family protein [Thermomicrobiales bacterium]
GGRSKPTAPSPRRRNPGAMISGVVLAAGDSSRLGRTKQLLPLAGAPLLAHVLRHAVASRLDDVVLVLGHDAEAIAEAVGEWGQRIAVNPDFAAGQSTSLKIGLAAAPPEAEAVLILLGDQPEVGPEIIDAVIDAFRRGDRPIVAPTYGGAIGNPVLFRRDCFPDLAQLTGDEGARRFIRARPDDVLRVPVSGGPPPADVDTEADYAALLARWPAPDWSHS